jgi:hypothetical protein
MGDDCNIASLQTLALLLLNEINVKTTLRILMCFPC